MHFFRKGGAPTYRALTSACSPAPTTPTILGFRVVKDLTSGAVGHALSAGIQAQGAGGSGLLPPRSGAWDLELATKGKASEKGTGCSFDILCCRATAVFFWIQLQGSSDLQYFCTRLLGKPIFYQWEFSLNSQGFTPQPPLQGGFLALCFPAKFCITCPHFLAKHS